MPRSRTHQKRKMKLRKRNDKFEALIKKRVDAFSALPEEDQVSLLTKWKKRVGKKADDVGETQERES